MPRRRVEGVPIRRGADDLWRKVGEPSAGATFRGYLRFSHEAGHYGLTIESQRRHVLDYAEARGWLCAGWDIEPAVSGKYEEIERRPVFRAHLDAAARGEFQVSLCYMADRWSRNKIVAYVSLSRLRKAGIWWATTDGKWTIDRTEEDGWDVAFAVEATMNAGYSRRVSEKTRIGKQTRATLGLPNGDLMYGYLRPADPPRPEGAPYNWKPPRQAPIADPVAFTRLVQLGEWAAAGLSDRQIAERANTSGWTLPGHKQAGPRRRYLGEDSETGEARYVHDTVSGPRPFTKDTVRAMLIRAFPREYAPGTGHGTILAPDGSRIEGRHPAAWSWDLCARMDAQRALHVGTRDHQAAQRAPHVWLFSGYVVCASCGLRLRADGKSASKGGYWYYRDTARRRGAVCPVATRYGDKGARADELEGAFGALLAVPLPRDWREQIAAASARLAHAVDWEGVELRRAGLSRELERLKFQHRLEALTDAEFERELARIRQALAILPTPDAREQEVSATLAAGETLAELSGYWDRAEREERRELVRLLLQPEGLRWDLAARRLVGVRPRPAFLPVLRLALGGQTWRIDDDWLIRGEPSEPVERKEAEHQAPARDVREG